MSERPLSEPSQDARVVVSLSPEEYQARREFAGRLRRATPWTFVACGLIALTQLAVVIAQQLLQRAYPGEPWPLQVFLVHGWKSGPALAEGELWRLVSSMWLHGGWLHVGVNLFALWSVGRLVERLYGTSTTVLVYMLAGIGGGLASWLWSPVPSVGASGALFGLLGALVALRLRPSPRLPAQVGPTLWNAMLPWLVINILLGIMLPNIDNAAHAGGFAVGLVMSLVLGVRPLHHPWERTGRRVFALGLGGVLAGVALALMVQAFLDCGTTPDAIELCYGERYRPAETGGSPGATEAGAQGGGCRLRYAPGVG